MEMQIPFRFDLNEVKYFNHGVVYLTSSKKDQEDELKDLFYRIKLSSEGHLLKEESVNFIPHLTLIRKSDDPNRDAEILKNEFEGLSFVIETIYLFKGINGERWKSLGKVSANNLYTEYTFDNNNRASI